MSDTVTIMNLRGYMQKYVHDGICKGADPQEVKQNLLKEFNKEIVDIATFRLGKNFLEEANADAQVRNKLGLIISITNVKWRNLCDSFANYEETKNLIGKDDLLQFINESWAKDILRRTYQHDGKKVWWNPW